MATLTDIRLKQDGDLDFSVGRLGLVYGRRVVAQRVMQRFMTFRGEWFLDLSAGVPYRQQILIKNPDIPIVDVLLRQTVLDTPDIVGLQRFSFTFDRGNREYAFAFVAETTQGEFVASVEGGASRAPIFLLLLAGD